MFLGKIKGLTKKPAPRFGLYTTKVIKKNHKKYY